MNGEQVYLYRAVDSTGQTIDFLLTAKRSATGAKALLSQGNAVAGQFVSESHQREQ